MKSLQFAGLLFFFLLFSSCGQFSHLYRDSPRVSLAHPVRSQADAALRDTSALASAAPGFIFVRSDGDTIPVQVSAEWDSLRNEAVTRVLMDEVVVAARSVRNTAERNGMIHIEFVVTVPRELQNENWMVNVCPVLMRGTVADTLRSLRFSGRRFRELQENDYRRYDRFLQGIIPDSVNFYQTFVDYRSFERYLERLQLYRRSLEGRVAHLQAKAGRPDPLLARFDFFNRMTKVRDSLLGVRMQSRASRMLERQQWRYNRALAGLSDTLFYRNDHLLERFLFFNARGDRSLLRLQVRNGLMMHSSLESAAGSATLHADYLRRLSEAQLRADDMIGRKRFFYEKVLAALRNSFPATLSLPADSWRFYPRFMWFNERMEAMSDGLYYRYRVRAARAESGEGVKYVRAVVAGKDTAGILNRSGLEMEYTRRYERMRDFFPMYRFRRPESDSLSLVYLASADTSASRRQLLSLFSEPDIRAWYASRVRPDTVSEDTSLLRLRYAGRLERTRLFWPKYTYRRPLPDSVEHRPPGRKTVRDYQRSLFDSTTTLTHYAGRYTRQAFLWPEYHHLRELQNIRPPAERYAARAENFSARIRRIEALDSSELVKVFYNTQKIARNEARKASKDEKFRDIVRFPFLAGAHLDTVIYAADKVHFLYSEQVPADEHSTRMKVFTTGDVTSRNGHSYPLPASDTLTYLVSSMTHFIDTLPRFVRRIVYRDAEASTSVDFVFPRNRFHLDTTVVTNREGLTKIRNLTLALMTDPVYIIDSLTLYATSSPEGNWSINAEMAHKRAVTIRGWLERGFTVLYDSLAVSASFELDEAGNVVSRSQVDKIPNLPELIRIRTIPEDWGKLARLVRESADFPGRKEQVLQLMNREKNPDSREYLIRRRYPQEYAYMRERLYPAMRSVDFRFSLSRRGMRQDTIHTSEPDTAYARGVEYLRKRQYEQALEILRPYEDRNTALAYMSLGYNQAALRIYKKQPQHTELKYLQAVLHARLGDEQQAVLLLLDAAEENRRMVYRANLDPELSVLVKKYGLFREDDF